MGQHRSAPVPWLGTGGCSVGVGRWAGDVWGWLGDNAMTRSWANTMDQRVVAPLERALVSEESLRQLLPAKVREMSEEEGGFTADQLKLLSRLAPDRDEARIQPLNEVYEMMEGKENRRVYAEGAANGLLKEGNLDREQLMEIASLLPPGQRALSGGGEIVRSVLGHPLTAYGTVVSSVALAVKGALDVYARMEAGQPVSAEEVAAADAVLKQHAPAASGY
jgi:hypothetical protein